MSSPNNRVFQVLGTKGNAHVLTKDLQASDLAVGQVGFFDLDAGKSFDATSTKPKKLYIAVGTGNTALEDIATSVGNYINVSKISSVTKQEYAAAVPQVIDITDYKDCCGEEKDYVLTLHLVNAEIQKLMSNNKLRDSFVVTPKCDPDCQALDINEITKDFIEVLNAGSQGLFKAEPINEAGNVIADIDAYIATNKVVNTDADNTNDVGSGIRITTNPTAITKYCDINYNYDYPRMTSLVVTPNGAFECCGTKVIEHQALVYEQGSGYDVRHMEYIAAGWNKRLDAAGTRVSLMSGSMLKGDYMTDIDGKYTLYAIENSIDEPHITSPLGGYVKTIIAVPKDDSNTITDLDNIFTFLGFTV